MKKYESMWVRPTLALAAGAVLLWLCTVFSVGERTPAVHNLTAEAALIVKNISLDEYMPAPGDKVTVSASLFNPGQLQGVFPVMLEVGDKIARTINVALSGNPDQVVNVTMTAGPVGTYFVRVGACGKVMLVTDPR